MEWESEREKKGTRQQNVLKLSAVGKGVPDPTRDAETVQRTFLGTFPTESGVRCPVHIHHCWRTASRVWILGQFQLAVLAPSCSCHPEKPSSRDLQVTPESPGVRCVLRTRGQVTNSHSYVSLTEVQTSSENFHTSLCFCQYGIYFISLKKKKLYISGHHSEFLWIIIFYFTFVKKSVGGAG